MNAYKVRSLTFAYTDKAILKDLSFEVKKGTIMCLLGNNGSGKTTLLNCLLGVHKDLEGGVDLLEKDMLRMPIRKRAEHVAYIPQHHKESFPYTVEEIVLMGRNPYLGMGEAVKGEDYTKVDEALGIMEIRHLKHRVYSQLSGGEMQMVLFARAYVQDTDIIIMDEPAASLDLKNERLLLKTIERLIKDEKKTIVMSSHSMNHPMFLEHRQLPVEVIMLREGRIAYKGQVNEVLNEKSIKEVYGVNCCVLDYEEDGVAGKTVVTL